MPISHEHAMRRGMVSSKAAAKHLTTMKGSASMGPPGKMTRFENKDKTDAGKGHIGVIKKGEINDHAQQKTARVAGQTLGKPGAAGKDNYKSAGKQPGAGAINENTGKKWPGVGTVKRANGKQKNRGNSGGSDNNGGGDGKFYYGGPNSNER